MNAQTSVPSAPRHSQLALGGAFAAATLALAPSGAQAQQTLSQYEAANPGGSYREVFVTQDTIPATSTAIGTYNGFATFEADEAGGPGGTWSAIVSTSAVNAITNADCGTACNAVPIFDLDGTEIAASTNAFFSNNILSFITVNQFGVNDDGGANGYNWTGSTDAGTANGTFYMGSTTDVEFGGNQFGSSTTNVLDYGDALEPQDSLAIYAISGEITPVTTSVPEPASAGLLALGGLVTGLIRRRRRA